MGKHGVLLKQRLQTNVRIVLMLAVAVVTSLLIIGVPHAWAVTKTTTPPATANTLKVTPVRSDVEIKPGESGEVKITVTNVTSKPILVQAIENDFVAGDEKGTPALILDADKYAPTHSLKRFMSAIPNTTIPANSASEVTLTITVPKDAQPGGYFGAVRFAPTDPDGGGQVNLSGSVASLVLLTVPGDAVEQLNLTDFSVEQGGKSGGFFQTPNNLNLTFRFENKGSIQEAPFGKITVTKGKEVVYSIDFNGKAPLDMVLPDSARRWDLPLKNIGTFGQYEVHATLTYGKKNQTVEVTKKFWVVPLWAMIAGIGGVVLLAVIITIIILALRSYKKRILRNHNRGGGFRGK